MQVKTLGMTIGEISMTLKEAIDIGRVMHCVTIADVDDLIYHLYEDMGIFSEQELQEYWDDYETWSKLYHDEFPNAKFIDVKI